MKAIFDVGVFFTLGFLVFYRIDASSTLHGVPSYSIIGGSFLTLGFLGFFGVGVVRMHPNAPSSNIVRDCFLNLGFFAFDNGTSTGSTSNPVSYPKLLCCQNTEFRVLGVKKI